MHHLLARTGTALLSAITASLFAVSPSFAHNGDQPTGAVESTKLTDSIFLLTSQGTGNVIASVGEDGTLLIDVQTAQVSEDMGKALQHVGGTSPKFLLNTHWHGDHTGGNEALGKQGATIIAHEKVRERLTADQFIKAFNMKSGPQPKAALPVITFSDAISLHWNEDLIDMVYSENAHTDSDSFIHFRNSNVIHTGDLYFSNMYPFIDPDSEGDINGVIQGVDKILARADDKTIIVPGHGAVSNRAELTAYRDMLKVAGEKIAKLKREGKTLEQTVAAKPTAELDAEWGNGFFNADTWVGIIYESM